MFLFLDFVPQETMLYASVLPVRTETEKFELVFGRLVLTRTNDTVYNGCNEPDNRFDVTNNWNERQSSSQTSNKFPRNNNRWNNFRVVGRWVCLVLLHEEFL